MTEERGYAAAAEPLKQAALSGFMWMSVGNSARALLRIAVLAILGRLLVPDDFGLVAAAGVVVWLSSLFANLGLGAALIQQPRIDARDTSTGFTSSVALGLIMGVAVYALAPGIAAIFRLDDLVPVLRALSLTFPIAGLSVVAECLLQRELKFARIARAEVVSYALGYGIVGVIMAWLGYGVWALVSAEITKTLAKSIMFLASVPQARGIGFDAAAFTRLARFGAKYTAGGFSIYLAMQGDTFIVARFLGATALGLYGRAYELMLVPAQALGVILDKVLFPTMSKVQHDVPRLRLAYRRGTALMALLVLPVSALTVILAPEIILALLGSRWEGAITPLRILALGMYLRVGYMVGHSVANAAGAVGRTAWRNALHAALIVAGALIGQRWGIAGVAAGVVSAVGINFLLVFDLGRRVTGLRWRDFLELHVPALILTAAASASAWGVTLALRGAAAGALLTVLLTVLAVSTLGIVLLRSVPRVVLGADGMWLVQTICGSAPRLIRPLLCKALAVELGQMGA